MKEGHRGLKKGTTVYFAAYRKGNRVEVLYGSRKEENVQDDKDERPFDFAKLPPWYFQ